MMERQILTRQYNKSLLKYYTAIFTVASKVLKEDLYVYMNDLTSWIVMMMKGKKKLQPLNDIRTRRALRD